MEAWEIEDAVADHYNRLWEEMNDPETTMELKIGPAIDDMNADPYADIEYDDINEAWACLETGDFDFTLLDSQIGRAQELIDGTPDGDRLAAIKKDLESLRKAMDEVKASVHEASQRAYPRKRAAEVQAINRRRAGA